MLRRTLARLSPLLLAVTSGACGGGGGGGGANATPVTVTITSTAALDGYVVAGGVVQNAGKMFIGDNFNQVDTTGLRGFVSFDLAVIPPGARVQSATMTLFQSANNGTPYVDLGVVVVDHVVYGLLLDPGAYSRSGLADAVGVLSTDGTLGPKSVDLTARVRTDVEAPRAQSQYRVRFTSETNPDAASDHAVFECAEAATEAERPVLVVTYIP